MTMAAMKMVSAGGFSGVSFYLRRCPQGVASVLRKKTPIFGSRRSKLDHLTVALTEFFTYALLTLIFGLTWCEHFWPRTYPSSFFQGTRSTLGIPPDHLLLYRSPNIGLLISPWELDKFKNCWNKSFRTSKILTLLYEQFANLLISQRGPRLGALSNNRWSGVNFVSSRFVI
jgi:hypothetical protein